MAPIALALMAGSTVMQTISGITQANAQAKAANFEARSIEEQAAFQEQQSRRQSALAIGKQVATGAASGVDITSGSPLFMELDNVRQAELEALNIRHQGALGAASKRFEGRMARAQKAGIILGGVSKLATMGALYGAGKGISAKWDELVGAKGGMSSGAGSFGSQGGSILGGWFGRK